MKKILIAIMTIGVFFPHTELQAQNLLDNGGFATGDLSGWTVFLTANGNLGSAIGLPNVIPFDVAGTGTPSNAAQFQASQVTFQPFTLDGGGGIEQTFNSSTGEYIISADIASTDINTRSDLNNSDPGSFFLSIDGTTVASVLWTGDIINPGQTMRGILNATVQLTQGPHQIAIEVEREALATDGGYFGYTPLQYVSNIEVEAVPEPSTIELAVFGLTAVLIEKRLRARMA